MSVSFEKTSMSFTFEIPSHKNANYHPTGRPTDRPTGRPTEYDRHSTGRPTEYDRHSTGRPTEYDSRPTGRPTEYDHPLYGNKGNKGTKGTFGTYKGSGRGGQGGRGGRGSRNAYIYEPYVQVEQKCDADHEHEPLRCMGRSQLSSILEQVKFRESMYPEIKDSICSNEEPFQTDPTTGRVYTKRCPNIMCPENHLRGRHTWMQKQIFHRGKSMIKLVATYSTQPDTGQSFEKLSKLYDELLNILNPTTDMENDDVSTDDYHDDTTPEEEESAWDN